MVYVFNNNAYKHPGLKKQLLVGYKRGAGVRGGPEAQKKGD